MPTLFDLLTVTVAKMQQEEDPPLDLDQPFTVFNFRVFYLQLFEVLRNAGCAINIIKPLCRYLITGLSEAEVQNHSDLVAFFTRFESLIGLYSLPTTDALPSIIEEENEDMTPV